jgi:E3 ubiquitin-protein ligase HECTD2
MPTWPARLLSNPSPSSADAPRSVPSPPPLNPAEKPTVRPPSPPTIAPPTSPSRRAHSRSISHPFPSLFGGSKRPDKRIGRELFLDSTDDEVTHHMRGSRSNSPHKQSLRAPLSEELVTGKCMTCDSTVRWPRTLKVFRCMICLMINDLEPLLEPRPLCGPSINVDVPLGSQFQKQGWPSSLNSYGAPD